jgi:hypothetical protein
MVQIRVPQLPTQERQHAQGATPIPPFSGAHEKNSPVLLQTKRYTLCGFLKKKLNSEVYFHRIYGRGQAVARKILCYFKAAKSMPKLSWGGIVCPLA